MIIQHREWNNENDRLENKDEDNLSVKKWIMKEK